MSDRLNKKNRKSKKSTKSKKLSKKLSKKNLESKSISSPNLKTVSSPKIESNNQETKSKFMIYFDKVDTSIDIMLEKIEIVTSKFVNFFNDIINFMKKSLERKQLKQVLFLIFISIGMAIVLFGINILFGKVIL